MRLTIGKKIIGVTTFLILAIVGIAAWSTLKMAHVSDEIESIAEIFIPITDTVAKIEVEALNQELILGTVEYFIVTNESQEKIDLEIEMFNEKSTIVDQLIDKEIKLIGQFKSNLKKTNELQELIILEENLTAILEKHIKFHDKAMTLLAQMKKGNNSLISEVKELQENLNEALEETYAEVSAFTQEATLVAELHEKQAVKTNGIATVIIAVLGIALAIVITRGIVLPLLALLKTTDAIKEGNLDVNVEVSSDDELADLSHAFNDMASDIKKKEKEKQLFGEHINSKDITEAVHELAEGKQQLVTVFYASIKEFSNFISQFSPEDAVKVVNKYFSHITPAVKDNQGVIDKYEDDNMVAFWTEPFSKNDELPKLACHSALEIPQTMDMLQADLLDQYEIKNPQPLACKMGIVTKEIVVGSIGANTKRISMINNDSHKGDVIKNATELYGTFILVDEATKERSEEDVVFRSIDTIRSKSSDPFTVYEPIGKAGNLSDETLEAVETFEKAREAYKNKEFKGFM